MTQMPNANPVASAQTLRDALTRAMLDASAVAPFAIHGLLDSVAWLRVRGLASFWQQAGMPSLASALTDVVTGLHGMHRAGLSLSPSLAFLVTGDGRNLRVHLGTANTPPAFERVFSDYLRGMLPGVELEEASSTLPALQPAAQMHKLGARLNAEGYFKHVGCVTGIPTRKTERRDGNPQQDAEGAMAAVDGEQIERVVRGAAGGKWGFLLYASPLADTVAAAHLDQLARQYTTLSQQLRESRTENSAAQNRQQVAGGWASLSNSQTFERTNREVQHVLDLLDAQIGRFDAGRAEGLWSTLAYFFADDTLMAARVGSLLRASFSGAGSRPEPLRVLAQTAGGTLTPDHLATLLTSSEVATLGALPQQEFNGYRVPAYTRFDVDAEPPSPDALLIGKIADGEHMTSQWFSIRIDDLSKHALAVGVTGSGKTTTIFSMLQKLNAQTPAAVPFLVIEPAKTEYRRLLGNPAFAALRVYTLGDERTAPFRLNPFEFDAIADAAGVVLRTHVQTHIDYLKSVFNAAFVLYAPMPYVLDIALHEVYEQKGWSLATGLNHRLAGAQVVKGIAPERQHTVFPTLSDLRRKVAEVVGRLGYEDKIKGDVIAGLQARIDSLRLGAKGLMLDVQHGVDLAELLVQPTVLELDRIGNDEEKAFIIGLLMARISAFRRLQGNAPHLRHVTVIEEAHRLLKNVSTEVGTEEASNKAVSVEVFANMLSEIRAYGEGVIIAEQIPAKLAPDAIKNTNLKLMHRLLAEDDRASVGATINLSQPQSQRAVALDPRRGEVIAFAEGNDRPYLLRIVPAAQIASIPPADAVIRQNMSRHTSGALYEPAPFFDALVAEPDRDAHLEIRSEAAALARNPAVQEALIRYVHAVIADASHAQAGVIPVLQAIRRARQRPAGTTDTNMLVGTCVCAVDVFVNAWSDLHGAPCIEADKLRRDLAHVLAIVARGFTPALSPAAQQQLQAQIQPHLAALTGRWAALTKLQYGPLAGCAPCTAKCAYRMLGEMFARDRVVSLNIAEALGNTTRSGDAFWREVARQCDQTAETIVQKPDEIKAVRICIGAHYGQLRHNTSQALQMRLTRWLAKM